MTDETEADLDTLYMNFLKFTDVMAEEYTAPAIAGVMMAQAMTLYRSILSDEDYNELIKSIYDTRMKIQPYNISNQTLQ
jgi:hypothetical protein